MDTLITIADVRKYTPMSKNLDAQVLNGTIETVEILHIEPCLGTPLYQELITQVKTNTLTVDNQFLLDTYLAFTESWYVLSEAVTYIDTRIENKGIVHNLDGNSVEAQSNKTQDIRRDALMKGDTWRKRMIKYLIDNTDLYPLFKDSLDCPCEKTSCGYTFPINLNLNMNKVRR